MSNNMIQLTTWSRRTEKMDTQYGRITYYDWVSREKTRVESDPTRSAEIRYQGDQCALFVNDVGKVI